MYCVNCGAEIENDAAFCSSCGAKVDNTPSVGQPAQPPVPTQPSYPPAQSPYGQQAYPPAPSVYGQPGYPPPPPVNGQGGGKPPRKKPGKGLWIGIGAGVLAIILILVLFVYPGLLIGRRGPLSGNTVQTRFVNDSVAVFTEAFSGLGDTAVSEMMEQPFEMSVDLDVDAGYGKSSGTIDMAYDGLSFGLEAEDEGTTNTLLLLEDTLYVTSYGSVQAIEFDISDTDLSENMALAERFKALMGSSKEGNSDVDWKKLTEMLVNSISKDCFTKTSSGSTLTMESDDLTNMLETFWLELKADSSLRKSLESFIEDMTGQSADIEDMIDAAVAMISAADPTLEWVVSYEKGKPVSTEITIRVGGQKITASFGYEKSGSAVDITFEINMSGEKIKGSFSYERTKGGLEFSGEINAGGQKISIEGNAARTKEKISGTVSVTISGETTTLDYDGTLSIGKPQKEVEDMFDIDTRDAYVQKFSELLSSLGYNFSGYSGNYGYYEPAETAMAAPEASEEPAASATYGNVDLDGTFWISQGYQSGGMYTEGIAMYFYGGMVYFGTESMTKEECYEYSHNFSPYEVYYTYDGYTITLASDQTTETQDFYLVDDYTMVGSEGTYFYRQ